jgi:alkylresorcinol/alkylpyrone synthase
MSRIAAVATVLGDHCYRQRTITDAFADLVLPDGSDRRVLDRLHEATGVQTRHLALPLESYATLRGFGAANDAFIRVGTELASRAVTEALAAAGVSAGEVDLVMACSVTGLAAPGLDARLVPLLGLRPDVKRVPVFGLGCVAGAAGIARVHDYLRGDPDGVAVLLTVELCSLTVQPDDNSVPNLVASGLFGDGAAAVVMLGEHRAAALGLSDAVQVINTRSRFYPDTERVMGWDIGASGFRIVLAATVADIVEEHLGEDVRLFLEAADLKISDVARWVAHPGGPKVLNAVQRALGLPDGALDLTWQSLAQVGNLSSTSVLHVLAATLAQPRPEPGESGLLLAMGPGFCAELVLLQW